LTWATGFQRRELLSSSISAMIGLVGFVVTVTVLLVQTATSQFSARYMRLVYRDRLLRAVLAVLVGTFTYSFVLLRRVGETEACRSRTGTRPAGSRRTRPRGGAGRTHLRELVEDANAVEDRRPY
jgi:uncharacterized membrane protein